MQDATLTVRAGLPDFSQGDPFLPGPTFSASFHFKGDNPGPYYYGRNHNPTWTNYELALGQLESGVAVAFSSGMAAITAVLSVVLFNRPDPAHKPPVLVMPSDCYFGTRKLVEQHFAKLGIKVRYGTTKNNGQISLLENATLLWLETPSNPELDVCGLPELIEAAHGAGSLVAVDNTTATPLGQKPLELGADFSVSSDTKALTGHTDLILGHVATRDPKWAEGLKAFRTQQGAIPGPMETWLAHRSLSTLQLRLSRQSENALEIAKFLARKIGNKAVRYPGLPEDPAFEAASKQMKYFGPVVSFVLENKDQANRFLEACKLVGSATSFGSVHTTAERRARWGGDNIPQGFIRLSAGCEGIQDLLEDIGQALIRALDQ